MGTLFARLVQSYNQTVDSCHERPQETNALEKRCKLDMVTMILETMDKEARWQVTNLPKSTEWHEFLKQLNSNILQNIGGSLRLKAMKKLQKTRAMLSLKHNDKVELEKFMQQLEHSMPLSEQRDIAMNSCRQKLREFED